MSEDGAVPVSVQDPVTLAIALADETRSAEAAASRLRDRRDHAIVEAIRSGITTRELGRRCGLTASQVSAIWRRDNPPRPRRRPPAAADTRV